MKSWQNLSSFYLGIKFLSSIGNYIWSIFWIFIFDFLRLFSKSITMYMVTLTSCSRTPFNGGWINFFFNFSTESNIWRSVKYLFEASATDSPGRQNIDALSYYRTFTTRLFCWGILIRLSVSLYGTIAVDLDVLIWSWERFDNWQEHFFLS